MSLSPLEVVLIAKQISDISVLGLLLKFTQTQVDAFEDENDKDLSKKKGTKNMIKLWCDKDDSTRDKLVKALRLSEMGELADRVEQGIVPDEHKRFLAPDVTLPKAVSEKNDDLVGISVETLCSLAERLGNHTNLLKLAFNLGVPYEKWLQYKASNTRRDGRVSSEGTLDMLNDWKMNSAQTVQIPLLNKALIDAGFAELAEVNFGRLTREGSGDTPPQNLVFARPSEPSTSASIGIPHVGAEGLTFSASKISVAVPDGKLNNLATHVPHGKYSILSEKLGIEYHEACGILVQHGNDSRKAMRECLAIWKDRTGGSLTDLKEILYSAEVGGTLVKYIE